MRAVLQGGDAPVTSATKPRAPLELGRPGRGDGKLAWQVLFLLGLVFFARLFGQHKFYGLVLAVAVVSVGVAMYRPEIASAVLIGLYLVPLFAFARVFSYVGIPPIYLPEVLLAAALAVGVRQWLPTYREFVPLSYKLLTAGFAAVACLATWHGMTKGYEEAFKGLAFVAYPLLSGPIAAWIKASGPRWIRIVTVAVAVSPIGLVALLLIDDSLVVSAAYGFYFAGLIGIMMCRESGPLRVALFLDVLFGVLLLASTGRRGPILTVVIALAVAQFFSGGRLSPAVSKLIPAGAFALAVLFAAVALGGIPPGELPGIGSTITRTQAIFNGSADASEANVAFRIELWKYSLRTAVSEGPLLGSGFGRPFALEFRGADLETEDTGGAHNSFVGIAYYMGFPALGMFLAMIVLAVRRVGKRQLVSVVQPAQAAWLAAGLVTMFTNVALEAPYIGGPFWLLLGWCVLKEPIDAAVLEDADATRQR
jgi:hypothetical protein